MKPSRIALLLFTFFVNALNNASGQVKQDPYFIASTDTISRYGPGHITREILQDKNGNFWFATWLGIIKYDGRLFTNYTLKEGLIRFHVSCCYEDRKGNLWFGTARGGVYRYDGRSFTLLTTKDGLVDNNVACVLEDKSGNMWFGTENGVSRYDGHVFLNFTTKNGLAGSYVNAMMQDEVGKLWFGTSDGISCYDGKTISDFTDKNGLPFKKVMSLFQDKKGNVWIGKMDGLTIYDGKTFTGLLSNHLTYYIVEDEAGNVLLSHSEPNARYANVPNQVLYRYDGKNFTRIIAKDEHNDFQIFGKTVAKNGDVWFGTMHGPCRYDGKSFTYFTK